MYELGVTHTPVLESFMAVTGDFQKRRENISRILRTYRDDLDPYSLVITHQSTDTNQDHRTVYEEVVRVFKTRCSIIAGCFPYNDFPIQTDRRMFIRLHKNEVKNKVEALSFYKSQQVNHRSYFDPERIWATASYFGQFAGSDFAEAFEVISLIF
jgi:LmbE family N-acetylglucosaminyl deacetylase